MKLIATCLLFARSMAHCICLGHQGIFFLTVLSSFMVIGNFAMAEVCWNDIAGFNNAVCTANDVTTAQVHILSGPAACVSGTTILVRMQAETVAGSNVRFDIGYWLALDGGDAKNGTCFQDYLPPPLSTTAAVGTRNSPYFNAEAVSDPADTCGDIEQNVTTFRNFGAAVAGDGTEGPPAFVALPCQDSNNDNIADVSICTTWDNQSASEPSCTAAIMTVPATTSKCNCGTYALGDIVFFANCESDADCNDNNTCTIDACVLGTCSNTAVVAGLPCDDSNACTTLDVCVNTICEGIPTICVASDQCHDAGICDFTTGTCSNPAKPDGTTCIDGLICTDPDTCVGGVCTGQDTCEPGQICEIDGCVGTPSECTIDSDCNDQNLCTDDSCVDGTCVYANNTSPCSDGNTCTATDYCSNGVCVPGTPMTCNNPGICQTSPGVCTSGTCSYQTAPDGTSCGPKKTCHSGTCLSSGECQTTRDCVVLECLTASCVSGSCIYTSASNEGKACGVKGVCHEGICAECNETSACSEANLCNLDSCSR